MVVRVKFLASSHEINVSYISSIRLIRAWMVPPQTNQTTGAKENSETAPNHRKWRHVLEVVPLGDSGDGIALLEDDNNRVRFSAGWFSNIDSLLGYWEADKDSPNGVGGNDQSDVGIRSLSSPKTLPLGDERSLIKCIVVQLFFNVSRIVRDTSTLPFWFYQNHPLQDCVIILCSKSILVIFPRIPGVGNF